VSLTAPLFLSHQGAGGTLPYQVGSRVLLLALLQDETSGAGRMLATMGVDRTQLETDLSARAQKDLKELVGAGGRTKKDNGKSMLAQCSTDLTEQARLGKLDLVVGRDEEVSRMMRILVRKCPWAACDPLSDHIYNEERLPFALVLLGAAA
jgi:ATP-dependent Clp protease ATP-binding subunit ClpA